MAQDISLLKGEIIKKLDITAYYSEVLSQWNPKGFNLSGDHNGWTRKVFCPFHADTKTPNMSVNLQNGGWDCFGCTKKGSIFDFHSLIAGRDIKTGFKQSINELAARAGIDIKEWNSRAHDPNLPPEGATKTTAPKRTVMLINEADAVDKTQPPISSDRAKLMVKNLQQKHFEYLKFQRGLSLETVEKYMIGFDPSHKVETAEGKWDKIGRYSIPVFGAKGGDERNYPIRNIRFYSPDSIPKTKLINTVDYGTPARIYMLHELIEKDWQHVFVCEGEFDCILLNQELEKAGMSATHGAVSGTHGCNTWKEWWVPYFYGRHVYFLYDVDSHGKEAVGGILSKHFLAPIQANMFRSVRDVRLPLEGSKTMKDVTDYFVKAEGTIKALMVQVAMSSNIVVGGVGGDEATVTPEEVDSFIICVKDRRFIDKRVRVPITIHGQSSMIYHAPRSFKVRSCEERTKKDGQCCSEDDERIIPYGHELFIQACMANKRTLGHALECVACTSGKKPIVDICEKVVMQEYYAHQVVTRWRAEENEDGRTENVQELVTVPVYILQPEKNIDVGPVNYMATGWIRSHPNTMKVTMFIEQLEPLEDDWKKFDLNNPGVIKQLKTMQAMNLKEILTEITNGVTRIYDADSLLLAVLLTYLSPLRFSFNNEIIRGWMNTSILGDSGTGKSRTYEKISDWLELGDLFSGMTGTRTGLLYAIKQNGNNWYISIGRYVMANGKIIAVDEAQEIDKEDIKKMALAMDLGWLDINQVASGGYTTQVRTILIMNPPEGNTVSNYTHGVKALAACFIPMFIRRLDLSIFITGKSDYRFYNRVEDKEEVKAKCKIDAETFKNLIHWSWTRNVNDIHWDDEATAACMERTIELATKFGSADDVPLVWPNDFRKKLARMATSLAILTGNFTDDYTGVNVTAGHVNFMARFVDTEYSSVACNLLQYSKTSNKKKTMDDYQKIANNFETFIKNAKQSKDRDYAESNYFCQMLLLLEQTDDSIRKRDLQEMLGVSLKWVSRYVNVLMGYSLVEATRSGYKPTRKFNIFMQKWKRENPEIDKMLDSIHTQIGEKAMLTDQTDEYIGREREEYPPYDQTPF